MSHGTTAAMVSLRLAYPSWAIFRVILRSVIKLRGSVQERLDKGSIPSPHGVNRNETREAGSTEGRNAAHGLQEAGLQQDPLRCPYHGTWNR